MLYPKFKKPQLNLSKDVEFGDGSNTRHIDNAKAFKIRGSGRATKAISSDKINYAQRAGIGAIALEYTADDINTNGAHDVTGFQEAIMQIGTSSNGKRRLRAFPATDPDTGEPFDNGSCCFVPDDMGIAVGYIPDFPFNRVRLACHMDSNIQLWRIIDDKVREEVEQLKEEIVRSKEHLENLKRQEMGKLEIAKYVRERALRREHREMTDAELEAEYLKQQLRELRAKEEVKNLRKEYSQLLGDIEITEDGEVETKEGAEVKKVIERPLTKKGKIDYRAMAQKIVYDKNAELVQKLKAQAYAKRGDDSGWSKMKEYKEIIEPAVDKLEATMRKQNEGDNVDKGNDKSD